MISERRILSLRWKKQKVREERKGKFEFIQKFVVRYVENGIPENLEY
jgi:hypothetical protein